MELQEIIKKEIKILEALSLGADYYSIDMCHNFSYISDESGVHKKELPKLMKRLRGNGFVEFHRGLMDEDFKVAGSGYRITDKGLEILQIHTPHKI